MAEEAKKDKSADDTAGAHAPEGGGSKLGAMLGVLNLLLTVGIGAVVFLQFQKDKHREAVTDIKAESSSEKPAEGHGEGHGEAKAEGHGEAKPEGHGEAKAEGHGEHGAEKAAATSNQIQLEQFMINLSTSPGTPSRFVRVMISIELSSGEAGAELTSKMAPARNAIIDLVNSKRPADLDTGEGRNFLKEEIRNALNGLLVSGKVKGVFFSAFAVSG
jgi:flagellar basal body-associated protein FliL